VSDERFTVLVVDSAPTCLGVRLALTDGEDDEIECREAHRLADALALIAFDPPDVVLVGQTLADGGIEAVRQIAEAAPDTAIVVLSASETVDDLLASLRAGAIGFVPLSVDAGQLRRVVSAVRAKEAVVPRAMVIDLVREFRALERAADDRLTAREAQILGMLRRGQSTATIADHLAISPVTVRRHISKLVDKAGVTDRGELLSAAPSLN
jgi:two-component system, NarL family, nitrate/nitrite response regulator NarL